MIKINIDTEHVADIGNDEVKKSACELNIWGHPDELKHELQTMLEAFEARQPLYDIWLDVLSEWAAKSCEEKGL